jgi:hypothetical protein
MSLRLLALAALLLAGVAQARPEFEARAGAVDLGALGSSTYVGFGLRHRFDETWAAYGTFDKTVSSSSNFDVEFTQVGAHGEAGKEFGPVRVTLQLGMVYTAYGIELRFKRVSVGWSQTDYANQSITSTSLIFHF